MRNIGDQSGKAAHQGLFTPGHRVYATLIHKRQVPEEAWPFKTGEKK
jgi:hypothetical protein